MIDLYEHPSLSMLGLVNFDRMTDLDELVERDDIAEIYELELEFDWETEDDPPQAHYSSLPSLAS